MIGVFIWSIEEPMAGSSAEVYDVCLYVYPFGGRLCCCWNRCDLFYGIDREGGMGNGCSLRFESCLRSSMNYN